MASGYTISLRLEQQATGENDNTWGARLNTQTIAMIEEAMCGSAAIAVTGGTRILTTNNGATDEARPLVLVVSGALTSNQIIQIPNVKKAYFVRNTTTGAFTVSVKTATGSATVVDQGYAMGIYCDGTDTYCMGVPVSPAKGINASAVKVNGFDVWHSGNFNASAVAQLSGANFTWLQVGGASVWHSGNFNPAAYALLAGPTFSGTPSMPALYVGGAGVAQSAIQMQNSVDNVSVRLDSSGNWGIYDLETSAWRFYVTQSGGLFAPQGLSAYSDARLKKDFREYTAKEALNIIRDWPFGEFLWKDTERKDAGTVAQAVAATLPCAVSIGEDGMMGVDYAKIAVATFGPIIKRIALILEEEGRL